MEIYQFLLVYLLLIIVLAIMRKCRLDHGKLLIVASLRMTVQLVLAGLILMYIFRENIPLLTVAYLAVMAVFTLYRILSKNRDLNRNFKIVVSVSVLVSTFAVLTYFICVVVGESMLNPQYVIPIAGMVMGNTMTGVGLGLKTFRESLEGQRVRINALLCAGASPDSILLPFARKGMETAMLPTINNMVGMGIVFLPGMMTGQILAGVDPTTAVLYQAAIIIALCAVVTASCFGSLYFGYKTMYDKDTQIIDLNLKTE